MNYTSTRQIATEPISSAEAIKRGLSPDGGLYMPTEIPTLTLAEIEVLASKTYAARAAYILGKYLTDYTAQELLEDCSAAYSSERFVGGKAPVKKLRDNLYVMELFHGPTAAFKDMALQIMPRLLSRALVKTNEKREALILVATSGDTGKAALEGYRDVPQVKIQVFYPVDGVSRVQKLQMMTQTGENVSVRAIRGNFDDAQNGVKRIFSDDGIRDGLAKKNVFLSSANSINWGRLAPQIVYYVSAYCEMVKHGNIRLGDEIDVCVPTGNFGNIFAGFLAKKMGLPIARLVCASNSNNVLTDFLESGVYDRNRPFHTTMSPSMDILISSNLERLIYSLFGEKTTAGYMEMLKKTGKYALTKEELDRVQAHFSGFFATEEETARAISETYGKLGYLADTHTGVALACAEKYEKAGAAGRPVLVVSTASPYKFACDVFKSLTGKSAKDELSALDELAALTGVEIPAPLAGIAGRTVRFRETVNPDEMDAEVLAFAGD